MERTDADGRGSSGRAGADTDGEVITMAVPVATYEALAAVAHDEGHSVEEQVLRAIQEMLTERRRRPLFD